MPLRFLKASATLFAVRASYSASFIRPSRARAPLAAAAAAEADAARALSASSVFARSASAFAAMCCTFMSPTASRSRRSVSISASRAGICPRVLYFFSFFQSFSVFRARRTEDSSSPVPPMEFIFLSNSAPEETAMASPGKYRLWAKTSRPAPVSASPAPAASTPGTGVPLSAYVQENELKNTLFSVARRISSSLPPLSRSSLPWGGLPDQG